MMSLNSFIEKWNGKPCDRDGYPKSNPYQCMDLMHQFVVECQNGTSADLRAVNAKTVYLRFHEMQGRDRYDRLPIAGLTMRAGDIVLWDGVDGHVAVFVEYNGGGKFTSFDQNYPVGSKCYLRLHTMENVLGVLRLKGSQAGGGSMDAQVERDYRNLNWEVGVAQLLELADKLGVGRPNVECKPENKTAWSEFADRVEKAVVNVKTESEQRSQELAQSKKEVEEAKTRISQLEAQLATPTPPTTQEPKTLEEAYRVVGKLLDEKMKG